MPAFDMGKGNKVTGIVKQGDFYIVQGTNNENQARSIQVHADGSMKNHLGGVKPQGNVDQQMRANIKAIFEHFKIPLPTPVQQKASGVSSEAPKKDSGVEAKSSSLFDDLVKAIVSFINTIKQALGLANEKKLDSDHDNKQGPKP